MHRAKSPAVRPVFTIPHTEDVLTGLFSPWKPKSALDVVTLTLLGSQVILWLLLPLSTSRWFFMALFAVFRLAYKWVPGLPRAAHTYA